MGEVRAKGPIDGLTGGPGTDRLPGGKYQTPGWSDSWVLERTAAELEWVGGPQGLKGDPHAQAPLGQ